MKPSVGLLMTSLTCAMWLMARVGAANIGPFHMVMLGTQAVLFPVLAHTPPWEGDQLNRTHSAGVDVQVSPDLLENLIWKSDPTTFYVNITTQFSGVPSGDVLITIEDESIAELLESSILSPAEANQSEESELIHANSSFSIGLRLNIQAKELGRTNLLISLPYQPLDNKTLASETITLKMAVIREKSLIDKIFENVVYVLLLLVTLSMGAEIDLKTAKEVLRLIKVPAVSTACQSLCMPLLAYGIVWLQGYTGGTALGLFMLGIAPGGGPSNMYTHLLGGDMATSVTMTLLSTVLSLAFIPFWIYTLGSTLPGDVQMNIIPFTVIAQTLGIISIPLGIGVLIQYKLPKIAQVLRKSLKVAMVIALIFIFTGGIYSSRYVFEMMKLDVMLTAALLPYGGFLLGGLVAFAFRLDWKLIKTLSIETGLQNSAIPFFVIQKAFASPDLELAIAPVVWGIILTPIPLLIATALYLSYNHCWKKNKPNKMDDESLSQISVEESENETSSESSTDKSQPFIEREMLLLSP
ncbi:ileal sodium/bile acid cotransporter-like [Watersipora subatra]|uniref:ileal sodium/bile acid cotransporter-like n=1 Tax=Watersipora subatra TaxID=2589382 RepID=UPI00355BF857